jgi:hypothetical protein
VTAGGGAPHSEYVEQTALGGLYVFVCGLNEEQSDDAAQYSAMECCHATDVAGSSSAVKAICHCYWGDDACAAGTR